MDHYYSRNGITLYHADCATILPNVSADLLLTDPPYGIKASRNFAGGQRFNNYSGLLKGKPVVQARDYGSLSWDDMPCSAELLDLMRSRCKYQIIFGGNYFVLPPSRCWLVWDKLKGEVSYADCELAWTNLDRVVKRIQHKYNGFIQQAGHKEQRYHPTQKPVRVMEWCISQAPVLVQSVLDPMCGVGSYLLAAYKLGKSAIGVEAHEPYCEVTAKRLDDLFKG